MRSEQEMLDLILRTARADERVRAVIMNGSRANPNARRDIFQDYDIVYVVTDVRSFTSDHSWVHCFGDIMIMQLPDEMLSAPPNSAGRFAYLVQFMDGNRIDLSLFPVAKLSDLERDSQSILLLDKDGIIEPFPPPSDQDYLPKPPTAKAFADCCNEFWWVCPYVAKGLWREEITYTKYAHDQIVRAELMKMLTWYVGVKTDFQFSPGMAGKRFRQYLEPHLWAMLERTYADARYESTWDALGVTCELFRAAATHVAECFGFAYPWGDDQRVSAHLKHVRQLPANATEMY